jgi:redox-regulated HSP33 family molecular chaperone
MTLGAREGDRRIRPGEGANVSFKDPAEKETYVSTHHVEGHHIAEGYVAVLVMSDQVFVHALRRTACRKTKHKGFVRVRIESLDAVWKD